MVFLEDENGKRRLLSARMYNIIEVGQIVQKKTEKYQEDLEREKELNRKLRNEISAIRKKCGVMEQMYNQLFKTYNGRKAILELIEKGE